MSKPTGGPAFPDGGRNEWGYATNSGMSMRDYFAANAPFTQKDVLDFASAAKTNLTGPQMVEMMAHLRYQYADAMLVERNKGE